VRPVIVALLACAIVAVHPTSALTSTHVSCTLVVVDGQLVEVCAGESNEILPTARNTAGGGSGGRSASPPPAFLVPSPSLGEDAEGNACIRMTYVGSDTPSTATAAQLEQIFIDQMGYYPACPDQEPLPDAAQVTPAIAAISFWLAQPLPAATPEIPPGSMLVGLPAYLVTNAELIDTLTGTSPFGDVQVNATSHLTVDWGDGTTTGPHHTSGSPYPNGDIAHVYDRHGTYDVVVTQHWSASWRIGDTTGTLPTRTATTRIDDFPVSQLQAVRND
jgi:hypothetical protein